jgi:hypothetical protein
MIHRNRVLFNILAILLSLAAVLAAALVAERIFERLPHFEDEFAYTWQAQVFAEGQAYLPTPDHPKSFVVPFVVDYQDRRFSKYPPGWSLLLALGVSLGGRAWVNPLLAGLGIWLTYALGKRIFNEAVGLLAAGLTLVSPFFLMNSGTLLNHPLGLVLSTGLALAWLKAFTKPISSHPWLCTAAAALLTGGLAITRPWSAVGIAIPFAIHGLMLLRAGDRSTRLRLVFFGLLAAGFTALFFLWQYWLTGDPLLNPYTLWWEYDKIGFGVGFGPMPEGHSLPQAWINTRHSLNEGVRDLFGWGAFSWIFLPFGLWAARRNRKAWLAAGVFPALVIVYFVYFTSPTTLGPRYFYEGLYSLTLLTAAGIIFLAGRGYQQNQQTGVPKAAWQKVRAWGVAALVGTLVVGSLVFYTPDRLGKLHQLYGIGRQNQAPFLTQQAQGLAPALFIVHSEKWMSYGALLELENPELSSPFIFAWDMTPEVDAEVAASYPDRSVFHYYPDQPYIFYTAPLPKIESEP